MTAELLLYCLVALAVGYVMANRLHAGKAQALQGALDAKERVLKVRVGQLKTFRAAQRGTEAAWSHVAAELPLPADRRRLLQTLTALLPLLSVPEDPRANLLKDGKQSALVERSTDIGAMLQRTGEAKLIALWQTCSYESLHLLLAELVKMPAAANASDFGALEPVVDFDLQDGIRSDFGGLEVIEAYAPAVKKA